MSDLIYVAVAAVALTVLVMVPLIAAPRPAKDDAAITLARRGYRLVDGTLYRVIHEDDEGWWRGTPVCEAATPEAALRALARMRHPSSR